MDSPGFKVLLAVGLTGMGFGAAIGYLATGNWKGAAKGAAAGSIAVSFFWTMADADRLLRP